MCPNCCSNHYDCDDTSICIGGFCEDAFGRVYRLTVQQLQVSQEDSNGESWDWPGGLPDLFVIVYINDVEVFRTTTKSDTLTTTFNESVEVTINDGDKLTLHAFDSDVADNEWIGGFSWEPLSIVSIKAGSIEANGTYILEIGADIEPVE